MSFPTPERGNITAQAGVEVPADPSVLLPVLGPSENFTFSEAIEALRSGDELVKRTGIIDAAHAVNLLHLRGGGRISPVRFALRTEANPNEMQFSTVNGVRMDWEELVEGKEISLAFPCTAVVGFGNVHQRFGHTAWAEDIDREDDEMDSAAHLGSAEPTRPIRDKEGGHRLQYTGLQFGDDGGAGNIVVFRQIPLRLLPATSEKKPDAKEQQIIHDSIFSSETRIGIGDEATGHIDAQTAQSEIHTRAIRFFEQAVHGLKGRLSQS